MVRNGRLSAVIALSCAVAGVGLVGCEDSTKADADASAAWEVRCRSGEGG